MPQTVFLDPTVDTLIFIIQNDGIKNNETEVILFDKRINLLAVEKKYSLDNFSINQESWLKNDDLKITIQKLAKKTELSIKNVGWNLKKLKNWKILRRVKGRKEGYWEVIKLKEKF